MAAKRRHPPWQSYEQKVFALFKEHYPNARVRKNVHLKGRFSKRARQVDILLSETTPAGVVKTVIDTKCFKRKVDVKVVDGFAGFVEDLRAQRGILITGRGFTAAALRRAFNSPRDIELDVLNFSELRRFQGFGAIPYAGSHGFLIPAPLAWVIDGTRGHGCLASLYQRGLSWEDAAKKKELIYINCWNLEGNNLTAQDLDKLQVANLERMGRVSVKRVPTVQRLDAPTRLRIADVASYGCLEVTGFVEFKDVIFFAVLLTPKETQRSNIRRLESVMRQAQPIKIRCNHDARIAELRQQLGETPGRGEQALLLRQLARFFIEMGRFEDARRLLEDAIRLDPSNTYWAIKELLPVLAKLADTSRAREVLAVLLRLEPRNPTVFSDCLIFASGCSGSSRTPLPP